ncbi:MAG TPA: permease-like cell division protein FtsX [Anaeromyxobacteraceae bacterium]|jgi:cell division transport system permease protein|nr:permease-like cell division protein FtsX [Anaeromyxobacteraceae bacterium]
MYRVLYFFRRAVDAMRRTPFVTLVATATIFVAVFLTGLFAGALQSAERLLAVWGGDVQVSVYLEEGADLDQAVAAAGRLAPGAAIEAVTPHEALARLAASLGDERKLLAGVGEAALPASVEVHAPGIGVEQAEQLAARLRAVPGVADVDFGNAWLERLERFLKRLRQVGAALVGALSVAAAVLVANTLRLGVYARRDEIEIMKLVGATNVFVELPFLIEGLLQGLIGAGLATTSLLVLYAALAPRLHAAAPMVAHLTRADVLPLSLLAGLWGGGAALGLVASAVAVRRFLRRMG